MSNSEDEIGPLPKRTKKRVVQFTTTDAFDLEQLPLCCSYEKSYMHRDIVSHVVVSDETEFVITGSVDGFVKFWKKQERGIEFVKTFKAHSGEILQFSLSLDSTLLATLGYRDSIKIFDVCQFDMIQIVDLKVEILSICWIGSKSLLLSDLNAPFVYLLDDFRESLVLSNPIKTLHQHPICIMAYNQVYDAIWSCDSGGEMNFISFDRNVGLSLDKKVPSLCTFSLKSETDLFFLQNREVFATNICFSPDFSKIAICSSDRQVLIMHCFSCKLYRQYDERPVEIMNRKDEIGPFSFWMNDEEKERRMQLEREISGPQVIFDKSGNFIFVSGIAGVKVIHVPTNRLCRVIGWKDSGHVRFLKLALFQGSVRTKTRKTIDMITSDNPILKQVTPIDPILFCTAYKKNRFYLLSNYDSSEEIRDVLNERPLREDIKISGPVGPASDGSLSGKRVVPKAVIHTSLGEIRVDLYPEIAPKAVENFISLSKSHYYDKIVFHRVMKGFMIQTGDPKGDGRGGVSKWGKEFEDEFSPLLKHDNPFMLSMANSGPNTNASQFFITTIPCPWLDMKHTIFGRCTSGLDTVRKIEKVPVNHKDRPVQEIQVFTVEIIDE